MAVYMIADTHFGDDNVRRYENRPFADAAEMDAALIANWNAAVSDADTVFLLGDFSAHDAQHNAELLRSLHGQKHLICGNHDTASDAAYREMGFSFVSRYPILYEGFWLLSHEPLYINRNMPYANIFGHIHLTPAYRTVSPQSFCVSAERIGYTPVPFSEIVQRVQAAASREEEEC